jgi:hypothetical protein
MEREVRGQGFSDVKKLLGITLGIINVYVQ